MSIWNTKPETTLNETVELYIAFNHVAGVQGIAAEEAAEKQFQGEMFDESEWASL